ncbi:MAG: winged helix-turn-helix domain-containing protein [Promethearchaeota archaeon]
MVRGVIYSIVDENVGPQPVYWHPESLNEEFIRDTVVKIMTISFIGVTEKGKTSSVEGKSIIPFPTEQFISFAYYFYIQNPEKRGGVIPATVSLLVERKYLPFLYEKAWVFTHRIVPIVKEIRENHPYQKLIKDLYAFLESELLTQQISPLDQKEKMLIYELASLRPIIISTRLDLLTSYIPYLPSDVVQKILPLLTEGELSIREISKRTGLSVAKTVDAIEFLREKGLVALKTET